MHRTKLFPKFVLESPPLALEISKQFSNNNTQIQLGKYHHIAQ